LSQPDAIKFWDFCFHSRQRERFRSGELGPEWAKRYPEIFDEEDLRIYRTECENGYHFYEWLGAVLLFEATGYLSLIEKYGSENHPRKTQLFESMASEASEAVQAIDGAGWPDLFCYSPDHKHWHFCEVKGAADTLKSQQLVTFHKLWQATGRQVYVLRLQDLGPP
jgi:hypothetical protein